MYDLLIKNVKLVTFDANDSILENHHLIIHHGKIASILNSGQNLPNAKQVIDHKHKLITPGLIDCHTHVIYGGNRANEFELRLEGASYEEIAKQGGGILSTVKATRQASFEALLESAKSRIKQMRHYGTTTCEIKSGYGLDLDNEIKMLKVARQLNEDLSTDIITTFLGAHALPPEFKSKDEYIDFIIQNVLPVLKNQKLTHVIDGFCEKIGFSTQQIQRLFEAAQALGFSLKLHAEQLSDQKGACLASQYHALSVDHLEFLSVEDVPKLKKSGTVAVLLPGAYYFLRETQLPPMAALLENQVDIALATDSNPGSSPFLSLPLIMNMACTLFKMTPYQAFKAVTINGAKALGISDQKGSIEVGKIADLILWDCDHYNQIIYNATFNYRELTIQNGVVI